MRKRTPISRAVKAASLVCASALLGGFAVSGQVLSSGQGAATGHQALHGKKTGSAPQEPITRFDASPLAQQAALAPAPAAPSWPVELAPEKPSVAWDSHGLKIDATNASLRQILNEVSKQTGAKVDGLVADERVFGQYGPGQPREVLSELLQGSNYNVLMIGGEGSGAPRSIQLSERHSNSLAAPAQMMQPQGNAGEDDSDAEPAEPQPIPQPINQMPMTPPGPPHTPQQQMQEMQQRQLMMEQQRLQNRRDLQQQMMRPQQDQQQQMMQQAPEDNSQQ